MIPPLHSIKTSIADGERVGFLGPNGAGNTTTLKVLSGLLHPSEGEVQADGHVPKKREDAFLKKMTLVMGQEQQLIWDFPPHIHAETVSSIPSASIRRRRRRTLVKPTPQRKSACEDKGSVDSTYKNSLSSMTGAGDSFW